MSSDPLLPPDSEPEPTVPPQSLPPASFTPVTPVTSTPGSTTGLAPNVAAGLSALTFGIGGIAFLILEKRDRFVRFWAMQSVYFGGAALVVNIAAKILFVILGHILFLLVWIFALVFWVVSLAILALWIVMVYKAFIGQEWEIPVLGKLAREQLAKMPVV